MAIHVHQINIQICAYNLPIVFLSNNVFKYTFDVRSPIPPLLQEVPVLLSVLAQVYLCHVTTCADDGVNTRSRGRVEKLLSANCSCKTKHTRVARYFTNSTHGGVNTWSGLPRPRPEASLRQLFLQYKTYTVARYWSV